MKITTENNVHILDRIKKVYIGFDDNTEVQLDQIINYDIDLDKIEYSIIKLTNALGNAELENHFKGNKRNRIIYVHIEFIGVDPFIERYSNVFYDIPCDMVVRKLKVSNDCDGLGDMSIELEGIVK